MKKSLILMAFLQLSLMAVHCIAQTAGWRRAPREGKRAGWRRASAGWRRLLIWGVCDLPQGPRESISTHAIHAENWRLLQRTGPPA